MSDLEKARRTCGYCLTEFECKCCAKICAEKCYVRLGVIREIGENKFMTILSDIGMFVKHEFKLKGDE